MILSKAPYIELYQNNLEIQKWLEQNCKKGPQSQTVAVNEPNQKNDMIVQN